MTNLKDAVWLALVYLAIMACQLGIIVLLALMVTYVIQG